MSEWIDINGDIPINDIRTVLFVAVIAIVSYAVTTKLINLLLNRKP